MARIGICGTHGVGKTTLLNRMREHEKFKNYTFCDEVTRWVKNIGFNINEGGDDTTQKLILMRHVYNAFMNSYMVTDRTVLDSIVYSKYLLDRGQISEDTYIEAGKVWLNVMPMYNVLFYIAPEFDIEDDGVRSTDNEFRSEIYRLFEKAIMKYNIPVIRLTGTVDERLEQILETLEILY